MPESITNSSASPKGNIRRSWLFWTVVILVCMLISFCLDRPMLALVRWLDVESLPGDFERTLQSLKEFGQLFAIVVACLLIFALDRPRRSKLLRLIICIILPLLLVWSIKLLVQRLRPQAADQFGAISSLGFYLGEDPELPTFITDVSGKERIKSDRAPRTSEKASFPSAHTAAAFAFAFGLAALYPSGRWIFYALAIGCGAHRILFEAHWFSDVVASVFIGFFLAGAVWRWPRRKSATG